MISIASIVKNQLAEQPLLRMMLGSDLTNIRAIAKRIRPAVENQLKTKVGLETIAIALHREAANCKHPPLDALLAPPQVRLLTTYHELVAINYPRGITGSETIPDTVRYFAQTTGSSEHTIIISKENLELLDTSLSIGVLDNLSALCLGLPSDSSNIESLYARIFLYFGLQKISIAEVVSTANELTVFIQQRDYTAAHETVLKMKQGRLFAGMALRLHQELLS